MKMYNYTEIPKIKEHQYAIQIFNIMRVILFNKKETRYVVKWLTLNNMQTICLWNVKNGTLNMSYKVELSTLEDKVNNLSKLGVK